MQLRLASPKRNDSRVSLGDMLLELAGKERGERRMKRQ